MCALIIEGLFCVFRFNFRLSGKQQILLNIIIRMTTKHSVSGGGGAHTHTLIGLVQNIIDKNIYNTYSSAGFHRKL